MPNSPDIVTVASIFTTSTTFNSIINFLLLTLFSTVTVVVNILYGEV